jgi:sortase (surface protein transpeptidase)
MGITGTIYFGLNIDKPRVLEPVTSSSVPVAQVKQPVASTTPQALPHSEPVRIRIPKIAVDTSVIPVGRRADDTMEVPRDPYVVGWYKYAPTPGEIGPAVMVGHVDRIGGIAIFWRLRELQPGDQVEIDRADGKTAKFRVDEVRQFAQNNFPTQEVYGNLNYAGIRLITCGGVFNTQTRHYSDNTVVFGSLVI